MRRSTTSAATDASPVSAFSCRRADLRAVSGRHGRSRRAPAGPAVAAAPASLTTPTRRVDHCRRCDDGRTVRLVGLGGAHTAPLLTRIAAQIDDAADAVTAFWGPDWPREIVIVAAGSDARVRAPRRRWLRHRGHHHRRADHVRPRCRRHERCVAANRVAPRAFPLRVARRHRRRRAALAHRGGRRFRRPPGRRPAPAPSAAVDRSADCPPTPTWSGPEPLAGLRPRVVVQPVRRRRVRHRRRCGRCICGRAVPGIPTPPPPCATPWARTCRRCWPRGGSGCPASLTGDEPGPAGHQRLSAAPRRHPVLPAGAGRPPGRGGDAHADRVRAEVEGRRGVRY